MMERMVFEMIHNGLNRKWLQAGSAVLLAVALLGVPVMAAEPALDEEEVYELSREDCEQYMEENEIAGSYVSLPEIGFKVWIPDEFEAEELTEEDVESGDVAFYFWEGDDGTLYDIYIYTFDAEGDDIDSYLEFLLENDEDVEPLVINGEDAGVLISEEDDTVNYFLLNEDGYFVFFSFFPYTDEVYPIISEAIAASIEKL